MIARLPDYLLTQHLVGPLINRYWALYREDTLDMRCGELWEIKPMRSAAIGVFQEFQYRHAFNLVNALMQDVVDVLAGGGGKKGGLAKRAPFFKGIGYFSRPDSLIPGLDLNWVSLKRPFTVGAKGPGRPLLAVPLTVPQLPGLLLYVLLDIPVAGLIALSALLAKALQDAIEKMARDYANRVQQILEALAQVALGILLALGMVVVFFLFWEILAVGAQLRRWGAQLRRPPRWCCCSVASPPGPCPPSVFPNRRRAVDRSRRRSNRRVTRLRSCKSSFEPHGPLTWHPSVARAWSATSSWCSSRPSTRARIRRFRSSTLRWGHFASAGFPPRLDPSSTSSRRQVPP